jgi:hypothetical protein
MRTVYGARAPAVSFHQLRFIGIRWRNAGISPASGNTGNLPQALVNHYDKEFIEGLHTETPFPRCATPRDLPVKSGNRYVLFLNVPYGGNTQQASEGTVGTGITPQVLTNTSIIGEFADYINFSSYVLATAIDDTVVAQARELAYRLAVTLSLLTRNVMDGLSAIDASVKVLLSATSVAAFTVNSIGQIRSSKISLVGRSVKSFDANRARFVGVIHPFTWGDCLNDTTNNSAIDQLKHTVEGQMKIEELPVNDLAEVFELPGTGIEFFQSNLVTQTANYNDGVHGAITGLTALRTYIMGKDAVIRISLNAPGDTAYGDGSYRNVRCFTESNAGPTKSDPAGQIRGWCSYLCHYVATPPPDTIMRGRTIDAASGIS